MMQPRKMLISIAFWVLMWNASQVTAWHWYESSAIQPSPSFQATQSVLPSQAVCAYWQFRCNNGQRCVDRYYLCDGWSICSDGSDEWYWNCRNSQLLRPTTTINVQASRTFCPYWQFRCDNGYGCVNDYELCDGYWHCSDGSDERFWNCRSSIMIMPYPTSTLQAKESVYVSSKGVRLVGGSHNAGRVEVYYKGQWGTVCDDSWDINDARVVCRQLGFQNAVAAYQGGNFRDGSGRIWLDDVQCGGYESSLFSCRHSGWGNHNCGHYEDAGVRCSGTGGHSAIKASPTVNVQATQSFCQYWQFSCDNGQCVNSGYQCDGWRQCSDGSDEWYCARPTTWRPWTTSWPTWLPSRNTSRYCQYQQFRCRNGQCIHQSYVCDGRYHCSDGSDEGWYNCPGTSRPTTWRPWTTSWPTWLPSRNTSIYCEYWQFRCRNGQCIDQSYVCDGRYHCSDGSDEDFCNSTGVRLAGGSHNAGRVEIYYNGRWGTVCDDGWNITDARIVCKQLGFQDAVAAYSRAYFGQGTGQIWMDEVGCRGNESSLFSCRHNGWGYHDCDHSEDAGVYCGSTAGWNMTTPWPTWRPTNASRHCQYWEFRCRNGQCIERYSLCDGGYDCYDGSDEDWYNCPRTLWNTTAMWTTKAAPTTSRYCLPWEFRCRNGRCISKGNVCDNYDNCGDGSDERRSTCRANLTVCQNKLDLGFILDSSGSVGQHNFERMKLFVKDLTDFYKLGSEETRVSVMSFSDSANIHIAFSAYFSDKDRFDSAVDRIQYNDGGTATGMALNMAYNDMFTSRNGARSSEFKKVLVILTDGRSNTGQVSGPARQLKNSGVVIFSVGIGESGLSMHELQVMASDPVDQHVITLSNFSQLPWLAEQMSSQTCNASHFQVFCDNDYMTAVFDRADLPKHLNVDRLFLRDRYCRADWNSTHVIVKTPLTGCGTIFWKNDQTLFFRNVLSEEGGSRGFGVITRDYLFRANLTCAYPRKRTVGSFSFAPAKQRVFVNVGGQGNFSLIMDVFKDIDYRQPYASQDYPVFKSLSDNLYIQYSINTSNPNLVVRAETCRATPTNRPYDTPQYVFIADGCDKDETIRHYSYGMSSVQRFSMQAFRFLSEHRFVYLHCDLVVCHRYDYNSTCARSTSCSKRYRRDVDQQSQDVSGMYALSFGPVMKGKESADKSAGAHSEASNTTLIGSLIGFGCLSVVLIGALLFMIQRSRRRRSDQTQIGVENKGALSMQNLGYT